MKMQPQDPCSKSERHPVYASGSNMALVSPWRASNNSTDERQITDRFVETHCHSFLVGGAQGRDGRAAGGTCGDSHGESAREPLSSLHGLAGTTHSGIEFGVQAIGCRRSGRATRG